MITDDTEFIRFIIGLEKDMIREIKDSLYGKVNLTRGEYALVQDRDLFGRLKKVHQLGASDLKYPGATHTRFEHSLGTLEVTWRIIN